MPARRSWKTSRTTRSRRILGAVLLILFAWAVPADAITYIYDELGRLVGVVDPAGNTAVYNYDAVGNILSIQNYPSSTVSIIEFTPNSGIVNATVTLYGTGYSTTPSLNTVTFNGITATITSSTATSIVTKVPAGATTGPIQVTAPGGSATTSTNFVVATSSGAPTITSFTPAIGLLGSSVTITGTNFDPAPISDKVKFNTFRLAPVTAATTTSLTATVPSLVGSGHLRVETAGGGVTSSGDFFIPPSPYTPADVGATRRVTYGGAGGSITLSTANKIGLVLFDATLGQNAVIAMSSVTIPDSDVSVYKPDGGLITSQCCFIGLRTRINLANLPMTGAYQIMVDPTGTGTGNMTLTVGGPDLQVTALTVPTSPVSANPNGTYTFDVTWTVKNNGNISATWTASNFPWADWVYLSANATLDGADPMVGGFPASTVPLAPAATYTMTRTVTVPTTVAPGDYYIILKTDGGEETLETIETNNTRTSATKVTLLGRPDLTVTALTVPTTPVYRNAQGNWVMPVSWTVQNQGAGTAPGAWRDLLFLSTDTIVNPSSDLVADQVNGVSPVAAGASYTTNRTVTIPSSTAPGTYYFIVVTDWDNSLFETNETNNTRVSATTVTLAPDTPDLVPTALTVPTTPVYRNAQGNWVMPVSWTVQNQGTLTAQGASRDILFLSVDTILNPSSDFVADQVNGVAPVAPSASYITNRTVTIPNTTSPGTYYFIVAIDWDNALYEGNENNNTLVSIAVTLAPDTPDLVPTVLTVPTSAVTRNGDGTWTVPVSWTVQNQGTLTAQGASRDILFLSADTILNPSSDFVADQVNGVAPVAPSASYTTNRTETIPNTITPGTYYFIVAIEWDNALYEGNETNNTLVSIAVTLSP
jgi:YD repeat-containing protein